MAVLHGCTTWLYCMTVLLDFHRSYLWLNCMVSVEMYSMHVLGHVCTAP
jgi:hypothetical protein